MSTITLTLPEQIARRLIDDPEAKERAIALLIDAFEEKTPAERFAQARRQEWQRREERLRTRDWGQQGMPPDPELDQILETLQKLLPADAPLLCEEAMSRASLYEERP